VRMGQRIEESLSLLSQRFYQTEHEQRRTRVKKVSLCFRALLFIMPFPFLVILDGDTGMCVHVVCLERKLATGVGIPLAFGQVFEEMQLSFSALCHSAGMLCHDGTGRRRQEKNTHSTGG